MGRKIRRKTLPEHDETNPATGGGRGGGSAGYFNNLCCEHAGLEYGAVMDWQQTVSLLIVAATVGVFLRARLRRRKFTFDRNTHCGCSTSGQSAPEGSIVFHARKGERRQIIVKSL